MYKSPVVQAEMSLTHAAKGMMLVSPSCLMGAKGKLRVYNHDRSGDHKWPEVAITIRMIIQIHRDNLIAYVRYHNKVQGTITPELALLPQIHLQLWPSHRMPSIKTRDQTEMPVIDQTPGEIIRYGDEHTARPYCHTQASSSCILHLQQVPPHDSWAPA